MFLGHPVLMLTISALWEIDTGGTNDDDTQEDASEMRTPTSLFIISFTCRYFIVIIISIIYKCTVHKKNLPPTQLT